MSTEVTDEMIELFKLNHDPANELEQPDIRSGIAAVLALVSREHEADLAKLRGAFEVAADSRNLWKRRAVDAGWRITNHRPEPAADHHARLAAGTEAEALRDSDGFCNGRDCAHAAGTEE